MECGACEWLTAHVGVYVSVLRMCDSICLYAPGHTRVMCVDAVVVARDLVAPQHGESSQARDGTCVPCIGRQILNRSTTGEVQGQ